MSYLRASICLFVMLLVVLVPATGLTARPAIAASSNISSGKLLMTDFIEGSPAKAVAVRGDYIYVGFGPALTILREEPGRGLVRVGHVVLPGSVLDIAVDERAAYVITTDDTFSFVPQHVYMIDVANPVAPLITATYSSPDHIYTLITTNDLVLLATETGLSVLDARNARNLQLVGTFQGFPAAAIAVKDSVVYLSQLPCSNMELCYNTATETKLAIIDISTPSNPKLLKELRINGLEISDIAVQGSYAYTVSTGYFEPYGFHLSVVDIAEPAAATLLGTYSREGYHYTRDQCCRTTIAVQEDYAYILQSGFEIQTVNISDRAKPTPMSNFSSNNANNIVIANGRLYASRGSDGLTVFQMEEPLNFTDIGTYRTTSIFSVAAAGEYVYATSSNGLLTLTSSSSGAASIVNRTTSEGGIIAAANGRAVIYRGGCDDYQFMCSVSLHSFDVTKPATPRLRASSSLEVLNTFPIDNGFWHPLAIDGRYAYAAIYTEDVGPSLAVVDLFNPVGLNVLGSYPTPGGFSGVAVTGTHALITTLPGLRVVDVADPAHPLEVSTVMTDTYLTNVAVHGGYAYVLKEDRVEVLDISNILQPSLVGELPLDLIPVPPPNVGYIGRADHIVTDGDYLYVTMGWAGLEVIDISNPLAPFKVDIFETPGQAFGVAVSGKNIYLTDLYSGLFVLELSSKRAYLPMISH